MIADLNRPDLNFTDPWPRVRSNTQPNQVRVSQTVEQSYDTDMIRNIGQGKLLQPESTHLHCLAAMNTVRKAMKMGRRRLLSDAWLIRQSETQRRQWSPTFKKPIRLTGPTARICVSLVSCDKKYPAAGGISQINSGVRRTERPELLRTGADAAVAAKIMEQDSPIQPHSGTIGMASLTQQEGGERDADGNEIEDGQPNEQKDPKQANNSTMQAPDSDNEVFREQERRVRTRGDIKGSLKTSLRVSVRHTGSPASAREPDTPQLQHPDGKFIVENVSSKTNSNEEHKKEVKIALRRSTRNQMREQSNKAFLQLPQGARSVSREDTSEHGKTRRPSHSNGGKSTTSQLQGTSTSNDDRRSQRLHARRQQTDAAARKRTTQSNKGKYNEKYHDGLYRFQDHLTPNQATFGLSFAKNPITAEPMIFVPTSPREAKALCKTGAYRQFRTFEAGQQQADRLEKQMASQIEDQDEEGSDESLDTPLMKKLVSSVYQQIEDVPKMQRQNAQKDPPQSLQQKNHRQSMHDTNQIRIVQQEKRSASSTGLAANQIEKNFKHVLNNQMKATAEEDQERLGEHQGNNMPKSGEGGADGKTQDCLTQGSAKDSRGQDDIARAKIDTQFIRPVSDTQMVSAHAGRHNTPNDSNIQEVFKEPGPSGNHMGRWTVDEHEKFLAALQIYGKDWQRVQAHIGTRSSAQIRSHAQKFFNQIKKKGHQVLIKDTKYKQTRSKRRRTSPQQDSGQTPFAQEPLPNELFVVEKLEQSNERRLARQTIIYDDWLKPKPGYTQLCEEYEREQRELRELGQQSAPQSYYCEEEGEDEQRPVTQSERRDVEQQSAAKPTEEAADAAGSEQPSKVSNTETVEEAQQAQSSSHHVTIEEQQHQQQRSPRQSSQSQPPAEAQSVEKQEQSESHPQPALLQLTAEPEKQSQDQKLESSRRQPVVRFENLSERRKAKVRSKLSNCLPFNPRRRESHRRQQKRILHVARPNLNQLERLQFSFFTLQHSKRVLLQRRWWLNGAEIARIASFKMQHEAQEFPLDDFDRHVVDVAGNRFLRLLRQIQSEIYLMQQQVGQPLQSPDINGHISMPSGNIDRFLMLFDHLIHVDLEEDSSATRLLAQHHAARTSTGSVLGQVRLANQIAQGVGETYMAIQQQSISAQLCLIGAFRAKLSDLSLKVQDMSQQIQQLKEERDHNQPLIHELDQQTCILHLELLLYAEFLNRLQASKEQLLEHLDQLSLTNAMERPQGASLPPTALLTGQQRWLLMQQQLENAARGDQNVGMNANDANNQQQNDQDGENEQQIVTETSHLRDAMWAQQALGADSWDMPDYMHSIMDKLGSAPSLLQMQQLMNLRMSQQQNQERDTEGGQGDQSNQLGATLTNR